MSNAEMMHVPDERFSSLMLRVLLEMKNQMDKLSQINEDLMRTIELQRFQDYEVTKSKTRKVNTHRWISDRQPTPVAWIQTIQSLNSSCSEVSLDSPHQHVNQIPNDSEYRISIPNGEPKASATSQSISYMRAFFDAVFRGPASELSVAVSSISVCEELKASATSHSTASIALVSSYSLDVSRFGMPECFEDDFWSYKSSPVLSSLYLMSTQENMSCESDQNKGEVSTGDAFDRKTKFQTLPKAQRELEENWKRLQSTENKSTKEKIKICAEYIPTCPTLICKHRWSCISSGRNFNEPLDRTSNKTTSNEIKQGLVRQLVDKWEQLSEYYKN